MRIDQLEIDAFGPLSALRADGLASHPLLVVHGENESGKTCLREFLATLLYGFTPASSGGHPWAPWSGAAAEGRAQMQLQDGRKLTVERRLRERPEGKLTAEGAASELGNRPLPAAGPVDRPLFDAVHAPRGDMSCGLPDAAWAAVRERLLAGVEAPHLRTAREASAALDARAAELWQPSCRARTRHRALSVRIRRLSRERERAAVNLRRLLELRTVMAGKAWHLRGMEEQLAETRARLLRAERLLPVMRGLQAAEELRGRSRKAVPQDDFGDEPRAALGEVRGAARAAGARAATAAAEIATHEARLVLSPQDQTLLAAEDEIRALVGEAAVHQQDVVHVNDLARERDAQEALFRERAAHIFSSAPDAAARDVLARLPLAELRDRVRGWEEAARGPDAARQDLRQSKEHLRACELDFEAIPGPDGEKKLRAREELMRQLQAREDAWLALKKDADASEAAREAAARKQLRRPKSRQAQAFTFFCAAGVTLLTLAFTLDAWWYVTPVALMLAWNGWKTLKQRSGDVLLPDAARAEAARQECLTLRTQLGLHEVETLQGPLDKARESLAHVAARPELERRLVVARQRSEECARAVQIREQDREKARLRVAERLAGLPMMPTRLEAPGQDLLHDVEELRAILREMTRLTGEREAVAARAKDREARALRVADQLDSAGPRAPMDAAAIWFERLHLALGSRRRADESNKVLPALREAHARLAAEADAAQARQQTAEARLGRLDPSGVAEAGLKVLDAARAWLVEADEAEAAVRRQFPDWQERAAEARAAEKAGETLDLSTRERVALTDQIAQLEEALGRTRGELDELGREREALLRERPLADVDGALGALVAERARIERLRDRLAALAALVRLADERWRARWQSPVLTAASAHLAALTGGRWDRLIAEDCDGRTTLFVKRFDGEALHEVAEPLSRALRGQVWLALRVALADQLDGDEPLPLVLDDPFRDWDPARIRNAAALLAAVGVRRQVVVLTGQASVAEALESQVKARTVKLPPPPLPAAPRGKKKEEAKAADARKDDSPRREDQPRAGV